MTSVPLVFLLHSLAPSTTAVLWTYLKSRDRFFPDGDYSEVFDTSVTEDDMEKSLREVLPAESMRQKILRSKSQSELNEVSSDEVSRAAESSPGGISLASLAC